MMSLPSTMKAIAYVSRRQVQLVDWPTNDAPLEPTQVTGKTLASLISPGTELNAGFDVDRDKPQVGGYAAVFEIDAVGQQVRDFHPGQRVLTMGNHASRQRTDQSSLLLVPDDLPSEQAVFARLMGVSWSTLTTTIARPPNRVLVIGLGPVGNLAAQIFESSGYDVYAVDPVEPRRNLALRCGLRHVHASVTDAQASSKNNFALAVDCSGHEAAIIDACKVVRKGGEVVLVGVPWKKRTDLPAFDVLHAIFHQYVILRSGWEWEVPTQPAEFATSSIMENLAGALQSLSRKRVHVENLYQTLPPGEAQQAYDNLLHQRGDALSYVFRWA